MYNVYALPKMDDLIHPSSWPQNTASYVCNEDWHGVVEVITAYHISLKMTQDNISKVFGNTR